MTMRSRVFFTVLMMIMLLATGCGKSNNAQTNADVAQKDNGNEAQKIIIGTGNGFKPYCYLDEKGELQGYELEVLKAVDEILPQYEFEFQTYEFTNVLLSLGSGKIDIAAHQFEKNPEREAKYLFGSEPYTTFILRITVDKDRNDINSLEDLHGKKVKVSPGGNDAYTLEEYNKEHDNAIKLVYSSENQETTVQKITTGSYDAVINVTRIVEDLNKAYGEHLKTVGDPIANSSTYYIYRKEDTQIKEDVDGALKNLKESGQLAKISTKVLGGDYTQND